MKKVHKIGLYPAFRFSILTECGRLCRDDLSHVGKSVSYYSVNNGTPLRASTEWEDVTCESCLKHK